MQMKLRAEARGRAPPVCTHAASICTAASSTLNKIKMEITITDLLTAASGSRVMGIRTCVLKELRRAQCG